MLTECNVRDCCRFAATVEARHINSASGGLLQSCRKNIQQNVPPNLRAPLFSGSIGDNLRPKMLFVTLTDSVHAFTSRADSWIF